MAERFEKVLRLLHICVVLNRRRRRCSLRRRRLSCALRIEVFGSVPAEAKQPSHPFQLCGIVTVLPLTDKTLGDLVY